MSTRQIINLSDFEDSKENIKPLREGRSVKSLLNVINQYDEEELEEKHRSYEEKIENYEGDDPLEVWIEYIRWIRDTFTTGNPKSRLTEVTEKCFKELYNIEKYRDDERFLKLCIYYSDMIREPLELFNFMETKKIGIKSYIFWKAKANIYEQRGDWSNADKTYQKGTEIGAEPSDIMKSVWVEFQARMFRMISMGIDKDNKETQTTQKSRNPLTTLRTNNTRSKGLPISTQRNKVNNPRVNGNRNTKLMTNITNSMTVYDDKEDQKPEPESVEWVNFGEESMKYKENMPKPTKWTEYVHPQDINAKLAANRIISKSFGALKNENFTVYQDDQENVENRC